MHILLMLACVAVLAAHAVTLRRRGWGELVRACAFTTALVAMIFAVPLALDVALHRAPGVPSAFKSGSGWFLLVAGISCVGFLPVAWFANHRARRRPAEHDAQARLVDAMLGTVAWVLGVAGLGTLAVVAFFVLIAQMAP